MNRREAEAILALKLEIATALELLDSEAALRSDWRIQFAAERVIERIFQAAEAVASEQREKYFGADGLRYLRGMRNRLAHAYLQVDPEILWNTISVDLPLVRERMTADVAVASAVVGEAMETEYQDERDWLRDHLRSTHEDD